MYSISWLEAHQAAVLRKFKQWQWGETLVALEMSKSSNISLGMGSYDAEYDDDDDGDSDDNDNNKKDNHYKEDHDKDNYDKGKLKLYI